MVAVVMMILRQTVHMMIHILPMTTLIVIHHIQVVRLMMILIVTIVHRIVVVHLAVVRQVPLNITVMLVDVQKKVRKRLLAYLGQQSIIVRNTMMRCKVL
ncbi:hypothetical protein DXA20_01745 [Roseburia sp. AM59-24XD]|nr:hypothetical protein DXA20_01745 [Roseburia sp. AM59-24XD]